MARWRGYVRQGEEKRQPVQSGAHPKRQCNGGGQQASAANSIALSHPFPLLVPSRTFFPEETECAFLFPPGASKFIDLCQI